MTDAIRRYAPTVSRVLLGLIFFVFGLNGFLQFAPTPELPPAGGAFMGALVATGYMLPLIKAIEVTAGALLLSNRFVPLALLMLAPIVVNIVAFHMVLAPGGYGMLLVIVATGLHVAHVHRESFLPVLRAKPQADPAAGAEAFQTRPARA